MQGSKNAETPASQTASSEISYGFTAVKPLKPITPCVLPKGASLNSFHDGVCHSPTIPVFLRFSFCALLSKQSSRCQEQNKYDNQLFRCN